MIVLFCYNTILAMLEDFAFDNEELDAILRESTEILIKE